MQNIITIGPVTWTQPKRTYYFKSRSAADTKHKITRDKEGRLFCYCKGFIFHRHCWHVSQAESWK